MHHFLHAGPLHFLVISGLLFAVFMGMNASPAMAKTNKKYASIVMDADTGLILSERYADKKLHPASLTKIMTLLMAFEAIERNKLSYSTRIRMSNHAASMVPSKIGLPPGSSIKAKDAIFALVTKSANDVAVAVAEHIGGSERNFAKLMTIKARSLGMRNTTFRNASGLHDPRQISTARDMAILAQYVINHYPKYYRYFSRKHFTYKGKTYRNHNRLMSSYAGMDGMKTGYIQASGFNLVASAVRNNRRIIGVVFGGRSGKTRNAHMASLLDKGFTRVNKIRIARARVPMPSRKPDVFTNRPMLLSNAAATTTRGDDVNIKLASMGHLIGEGDYDLHKIKRIETGMIAIAAHTGRALQQKPALIRASAAIAPNAAHARAIPASLSARQSARGWSIQIGALASRAATDQLLAKGMQVLPAAYAKAAPVIAPLKTQEGWLFRGRLGGFTQSEALAACAYFRECMTIAPNNR